MSKRADGDRGDAAVFDVGCYATNDLAVVGLHLGHFGVVGRVVVRIDLSQKQLGCVVEEARDGCAPLHEPYFRKSRLGACLVRIQVSHGMHRPGDAIIPCVRHAFQP